jgi:hypothetical protein
MFRPVGVGPLSALTPGSTPFGTFGFPQCGRWLELAGQDRNGWFDGHWFGRRLAGLVTASCSSDLSWLRRSWMRRQANADTSE